MVKIRSSDVTYGPASAYNSKTRFRNDHVIASYVRLYGYSSSAFTSACMFVIPFLARVHFRIESSSYSWYLVSSFGSCMHESACEKNCGIVHSSRFKGDFTEIFCRNLLKNARKLLIITKYDIMYAEWITDNEAFGSPFVERTWP